MENLSLTDDLEIYEAEEYPVHKASRDGRSDVITALLHRGHHVNLANFDLVQPLHEACFLGHLDCVRTLLDAGAEVNCRNIDGGTPLCDASSSGHVDVVRLLLERGAKVNPPLLLASPLHEAVLRDKWKCASLLVEAGASLDHTDCHFGTPLHIAALKGYTESAKILLNAGANVDALKVHCTPLHFASSLMDFDMILVLLEYGANVYARDNHGCRPRDAICVSSSPAKQLLLHWEKTPRTLKHFCRLNIRQYLGAQRLHFIDDLELPKLIISYLKYG